MKLRRLVQGVSLLLFLALLLLPAGDLVGGAPSDLFLRMDPLVFLAGLASGHAPFGRLLPGLLVVLLTPFLGRLFCSTLCPLGTTIDLADRLLLKARKKARPLVKGRIPASEPPWQLPWVAFIAGTVAAGSSLLVLVSPLSLATRFYGLVLAPALASALDLGARTARGAGEIFGIGALEYLSFPAPGYSQAWVTLALMASVLGLGVAAPRFWCRFLCPSGALLALLSRARLLKRDVSDACTGCGACRKACPMGAVDADAKKADPSACIVCEGCREVCPEGAVAFRFGRGGVRHEEHLRQVRHGSTGTRFSKKRRALLYAGVCGAGGAAFSLSLPGGLLAGPVENVLVRPPGALPERAFLASCVRCGECMKACPTNTLQPAGLGSGVAGFLAPVVVPRKGPCEPSCTRCGQVCPTGAVKPLPLAEKTCARIGAAAIVKDRCIAWEKDRECLVCDEVCPYGAVELRRTPENKIAVPFVDERRCNGCGFCEHHCPVEGPSAIVVEPKGALRLESGSYVAAARAAGLSFERQERLPAAPQSGPAAVEGGLPPGFEE